MSAHVFHFPNRIDPARLRPEWVACIILSLAGVVGMDSFRQSQPLTALARRTNLQPLVRASGEVVVPPEQVGYVSPNLSSPVQRIGVLLGANVKEGQPLADLSAPEVDQRLAAAKFAYRIALQAYKSAKEKPDPTVSGAREIYAAARVQERQARAQLASWQAQSLVTDESSSSVVLTANTSPDDAPPVDPQQLSYERAAAGQALWTALQARDEALSGLREHAETAQSELLAAQRAKRHSQVLAPISGTVIQMDLAPGPKGRGDSAAPAATIVNLNKLQVKADLPNGAEQAVRPGSKAQIEVTEQPDRRYHGVVKSIEEVLASKGNVVKRAVIEVVDNTHGYVKPGMHATAVFNLPARNEVVVVPYEAVRFDDAGRTTVTVITAKKHEERAVTLGADDGVSREIVDGLKPNEVIALPKMRR